MNAEASDSSKQLKMVACPGCGTKLFLPGELAPLAETACTKCGVSVMMPMRLRQFELRGVVGRGGMATVYRAFDQTLEREVAVKLMKPELEHDRETFESFLREARACARLNHTNIIHIYTFDEWEGQRYLVMELADHGSLDSRIEHEKRVPELDILDIGIKVASALDTALKHRLLHRDIKPGNILFDADGEPKLVDFGLARSAEADHDYYGAVWGTPYYIAPEKVRREKEEFWSDMYSLAATLYHAITGHVPFEAPSVEEVVAAHIHTAVTPPDKVVPGLTTPTSEVLIKAMAKLPPERYASYDEFIMALTAARSQYLVGRMRNQQEISGRQTAARSWWRR